MTVSSPDEFLILQKQSHDFLFHTLKICDTFSETFEDVYRSELGNLLHLPDPNVDLHLPGVVQSYVEPLQDGRGLVLPGADDEGEPEFLPVLCVMTSQPLQLFSCQKVDASRSLLPC